MKKILNTILVGILLFTALLCIFWTQINEKINTYAITQAQQKYGHLSLSPDQEEMIRSIAREMDIYETIIIRKMNYKALREFGYNNAFVFFYSFLNCIPLCDTPFLFVSEGFFEDLSREEQRFLIGHELVHAQEHHTQYLNMFLIIYWIVFMTLYGLGRFIFNRLSQYLQIHYGKFIAMFVTRLPMLIIFYIPVLASLAYRRHIERIADNVCLAKLKEYDGACKLIDRWHNDFKIPLHNPYCGIFSTHPSCFERKKYCLELKNSKGKA